MSEAADEPQVFNRNTQIEGIQACDPCDPAHGTEEPYDEAGVLPRPIMIPHPSECLPRRKRKSKWLPRQDRRNASPWRPSQPKVEGWHSPVLHLGERSEEHTSELQSLMRISYAVFCLKKKKKSIIQCTKKPYT